MLLAVTREQQRELQPVEFGFRVAPLDVDAAVLCQWPSSRCRIDQIDIAAVEHVPPLIADVGYVEHGVPHDAAGIPIEFIQDDISMSHRHVLRGIHGVDVWYFIGMPEQPDGRFDRRTADAVRVLEQARKTFGDDQAIQPVHAQPCIDDGGIRIIASK